MVTYKRVQMCEKGDAQTEKGRLLLSATFTIKFQLLFVLEQESAVSKNFKRVRYFNPNLVGVFRGSFWGGGGGGGGKITPPPPVWNSVALRKKLEMWHVSTDPYLVSGNISFSTKVLLILLMSAFFGQNNTFTQSNSVRAVLEMF